MRRTGAEHAVERALCTFLLLSLPMQLAVSLCSDPAGCSAPTRRLSERQMLHRRGGPEAAGGLVLRGGGGHAPADARAANSSRQTWKDLVDSQTRVPFEIMGSPLLDDSEIKRIDRLRREQRGEALEPAARRPDEHQLFAQPRTETGPNGTYGPPDLTGRRWRSLNVAGNKQLSSPRVELRYRVNKAQAELDPNLRVIDRNLTNDQDYVEEVQEEFPDDGTVDGFFNWYAHNKDNMYEEFKKYFPVPNLTLAPWTVDQPSGYVVEYYPVSRSWRPQSCKAEDSLVLASDSMVSWGDNRWGQLGLGHASSEPNYGAIPQWFCGGAVTGYNNSGMPNDHWGGSSAGALRVPAPVPAFRDRHVLTLAAGWNHCICVTRRRSDVRTGKSGDSEQPVSEVWGWGLNLFGQLGLGHRQERVTQPCRIAALEGLEIAAVACGQGHSMVLLQSGHVLAFGDNSHGQLGLSPHDSREYEGDTGQTPRGEAGEVRCSMIVPVRCKGGRDRPVDATRVAQHAGVSLEEQVEQFGELEDQLGTQAEGEAGWGEFLWAECMNVTRPVRLSGVVEARQVACGDYHTLILAANGSVMACGANCCGQLGLGSLQPSRVPQVVAALAGREIVSIACGSEHSVAAARGGEVWAWGRNIHGQLGNMVHPFHVRPPDYPRELLPVLMVFQPAVAGVEVRQVACGRDHTVVLFEDGRLWGCGHNFKFQLGIEHGQNAYYATCMSSVWSRYVQFDQEEEPPPKEPEVMSIEEYTRRVSEGQKKLSMRQGHLGVHGYFFQEDAGREEQPGQQSEADAPKVLEVACGEEHTVALLDNGHVVACGSGENGQLGVRVPAPFAAQSVIANAQALV